MTQQRWVATKSFKVFLLFFIVTSMLLAVSAYQYITLKVFIENSLFAWGKIISITQKEHGKEGMIHFLQEMDQAEYKSLVNYYHSGKYVFYPTIEFVDQHGTKHQFVSQQGFPSQLLGFMEKVEVRYDPNHPQKALIDTPRNYHAIHTWLVLASFPGTITFIILLGAICRRWLYLP